jgi:hypothetical protein
VRESRFVNFGVAWGLAKEMRSSFTTDKTHLAVADEWGTIVPLLFRLVVVMGEGERGDVAMEEGDG